jgi:hypothetical protein
MNFNISEIHLQTKLIDRTLIITYRINRLLMQYPKILTLLTIVTSYLLDFIILVIMIEACITTESKEIIILWISIIIRQISQLVIQIDPVPTLLWKDPGLPSLFVNYQVKSDFYFSGHTTCSVIAWLFLQRYQYYISSWLLLILEISFISITHSHYYTDILTGIMTPLAIAFIIGY